MMYFTKKDKEIARRYHEEFAAAIAEAVVERERHEIARGLQTVHVAAYSHRFGTDLAVFTTGREALRALGDIATRQCARDPELRDAVTRVFGRWPAHGMDDDELTALLDAWPSLATGECLWISECAVEFEAARRRDRSHMTPPCAGSSGGESAASPDPSQVDSAATCCTRRDSAEHPGTARDPDRRLSDGSTG